MLMNHSQGLNAAALRHRLASSDDQVGPRYSKHAAY